MLKRGYLWFVMALVFSPLVFPLGVKDDIVISLEEKQIQDFSMEGLSLVFYINLSNSSSKTYHLSRYSYRFVVNDKEYLRLQTPLGEEIRMGASQKTLIALPVKITYSLLFETIEDVGKKPVAHCYLIGEMAFSEGRKEKGRLPFAFSGEFPVFAEPLLELSSVHVRTLTIGGAEAELELQLSNGNAFDLFLDRMHYSLKLGGHPIENRTLSPKKSIARQSDQKITIPLLISFFDVGRDVHGLLQGDELNSWISGEMEFDTDWGIIAFPFDIRKRMGIVHSQ